MMSNLVAIKTTIMATVSTKFSTVDEYETSLPASAKKSFKVVRKTVKEAAPQAEEVISYNIPALKLHGGLVYYAGYKEHISLYPITAGLEKAFKKELDLYRSGKATIQFPLDKPIPLDLITKMVKVRVQENTEKAKLKTKK
jgi:uncharacterized protein YdhG (YjbR/CyaY superfamily)